MLSRIVLNKYVVSFIAVLYMSRGQLHLRRTVVAVGSVVLLFSLSLVFSPSTSARFLERGIDHLWLLLMSIVFWSGLDRRLNAVVASARAGLKGLVVAILIVTAGFGFWVLLDINRTDARRFIPDAQWVVYDWLAKNASGQTIAALNWDDIEFIAVYHGDIKSVWSF